MTWVTLVTLDCVPCVSACPFPRTELQWVQLARRLDGAAVPPRDRGMMWSAFVATGRAAFETELAAPAVALDHEPLGSVERCTKPPALPG